MTMTGKPRGEYAKSAARRAEILHASVQVFAESGFRGGSIREIAERVGISQAGLLHHFASKHELLENVLMTRDELSRTRLGWNGPDAPTGLDLIRGLVELTEYNSTTPGLVSLFAVLSGEATAPEHPAHDYFRARYLDVVRTMTEAFTLAKERGEVRPEVDPAAAARTLIAISDGLQVQWLYEDFALDMAGDMRKYVEGLITVPF